MAVIFGQNCALRGLHVPLKKPIQTKIKSTHWNDGAVCIVQEFEGFGKDTTIYIIQSTVYLIVCLSGSSYKRNVADEQLLDEQ